MVSTEVVMIRKYRFILPLLSAILLFSHIRDVYGQALNRDIEELIQDIVSDVIKPDSGQSKRSRLPEHGY